MNNVGIISSIIAIAGWAYIFGQSTKSKFIRDWFDKLYYRRKSRVQKRATKILYNWWLSNTE